MEIICSHTIGTGNCTNSYGIIIGSFIPLYADAANGCRKYSERLPDIIIEAALFDYIADNEIGTTENVQSFRSDFPDNADSKTRAREWLTVDNFFRKSQFTPQLTNFILEQFTQRFNKAELHILRKTAYIVVRLNGRSSGCTRFHYIRIQCALYQEFYIWNLVSFFLECMNKFRTNGLTLLFRFSYTLEEIHKVFGRINMNQFHVELVCECIHYLFSFTQTQESVIYEYAGQLISDSLVNQYSGN